MSAADHETSSLKTVTGAALIVMSGFAASKVLGLVRNLVIGHQYGASREYELFLAALAVPDTLFQVLAGGAVASAFIPVFNTYLARDDRPSAWRLVCALAHLGALGLGGAALVLGLAAPLIVSALVPGWSAAEQERTVHLIRMMSISPAIFALSTLATSTLNAVNRFALAAAAPLLYNLALAGGAVLLRPLGAEGLAISAVVGALLHLLVQLPGLARIGMRYVPTLGLRLEGTREVARLMGPRMLGLGVSQLNLLVAIALASFLVQGSIAYLSYAWLVVTVPLGVAAMGLSTAAFPELSRLVATQDLASARRTFLFVLALALGLALPAAAALVILAQPVISLLLERGAFGPAAAAATAFALRWYAIGLPGHAAIEAISRAFYAVKDTATPVRVAGLGAALNLGFSLVLMRTELSYGGLALANSLAALAEASVLLGLLHRRLGWMQPAEVTRFARPAVLGSAGFAAGCWLGLLLLDHRLDLGPAPNAFLTILAGALLGALAAAGLLFTLGGVHPRRVLALARLAAPGVDNMR